ncbi:triacylglycerol lipase [Pacificibacter maritimus]|uniref:Triacylglycerol lipase n=1 Tax=Pacificibacter maritimus TaxID=762213 RepID=A0A3N4UNH4_9RHOB|nr:alpha/beta hydrolase [Pacificibacter maritimus]RPE72172.1 triacylglycerol lipase [Pacificibacter maritimus]
MKLLSTTCRAFGVVTVLMLGAQNASAQMASEIAEQIRAMGRTIAPPPVMEIYKPLHESEPYTDVSITRDVAYGPHERNLLDVFTTDGAENLPVLVFVHGGAFQAGNKYTPGSPFLDNIMLMAARNEAIGVNMTYPLAPEHQWPAGPRSVGQAIDWVIQNIADYGGDPDRIVLMGHSAGAVHVASYVAFPEHHAAEGSGLAGAVFVSGLFDFTQMENSSNELAYFGDKAGTEEVSSLAGLIESDVPVLLVDAELDPPTFSAQTALLEQELCDAGKCATRLQLRDHSHISEIYAINTNDTTLSDAVMTFVTTIE